MAFSTRTSVADITRIFYVTERFITSLSIHSSSGHHPDLLCGGHHRIFYVTEQRLIPLTASLFKVADITDLLRDGSYFSPLIPCCR